MDKCIDSLENAREFSTQRVDQDIGKSMLTKDIKIKRRFPLIKDYSALLVRYS